MAPIEELLRTCRHTAWRVRRWFRHLPTLMTVTVASYGLVGYVIMPTAWRLYGPPLIAQGKAAMTQDGFPSDPINVSLVGTREDVIRAMQLAGWQTADRTTMSTGLRMISSVVCDSSYPSAPMNDLYVWGRRQDLGFQQQAGNSPRQRHHVRFWRSDQADPAGRPIWLGAATFDCGVGLSPRTGQITHRIAADVDAERDKLIRDLHQAGLVVRQYQAPNMKPTRDGRNGTGDVYHTDGNMTVGVLAGDSPESPPEQAALR